MDRIITEFLTLPNSISNRDIDTVQQLYHATIGFVIEPGRCEPALILLLSNLSMDLAIELKQYVVIGHGWNSGKGINTAKRAELQFQAYGQLGMEVCKQILKAYESSILSKEEFLLAVKIISDTMVMPYAIVGSDTYKGIIMQDRFAVPQLNEEDEGVINLREKISTSDIISDIIRECAYHRSIIKIGIEIDERKPQVQIAARIMMHCISPKIWIEKHDRVTSGLIRMSEQIENAEDDFLRYATIQIFSLINEDLGAFVAQIISNVEQPLGTRDLPQTIRIVFGALLLIQYQHTSTNRRSKQPLFAIVKNLCIEPDILRNLFLKSGKLLIVKADPRLVMEQPDTSLISQDNYSQDNFRSLIAMAGDATNPTHVFVARDIDEGSEEGILVVSSTELLTQTLSKIQEQNFPSQLDGDMRFIVIMNINAIPGDFDGGQFHWVGLVIDRNGGRYNVSYVNPMGFQISDQVARVLNTILRVDRESIAHVFTEENRPQYAEIEIPEISLTERSNTTDCGPFLVWALTEIINGGNPADIITERLQQAGGSNQFGQNLRRQQRENLGQPSQTDQVDSPPKFEN